MRARLSHRRSFAPIATALAIALAASAADAQTRQQQAGVLAGGPQAVHALTLNLAAGGGYDDNLQLANEGVFGDGGSRWLNDPGSFGQLSAELLYRFDRPRVSLAADGGALIGRYQQVSDPYVATGDASIVASVTMTKHTRLHLGQTAARKPYYASSFVPTASGTDGAGRASRTVDAIDLIASRADTFVESSAVDLARTIGRRSELTLEYRRRSSIATESRLDLRTQSAAVHLSQGVSRHASVRLGYGHEEGVSGSGAGRQNVVLDDIGAGFDYRRALSFSRHTTVAFSSGAVAVKTPRTRLVEVTGDAQVRHELGRSWELTGWYHRDVSLLQVSRDPVAYDELAVGVAGAPERRTRLSLTAAAVAGSAAGSSDDRFQMYRGTAGLTVALGRRVALSTDYSYVRYVFPLGSVPSGDIWWHNSDRHAFRVQIVTAVPIVERGEKRDAAR